MYPDEQRLKEAAEAQYAAQCAAGTANAAFGTGGIVSDCTAKTAAPTLRERLQYQLQSAQRESRKRDALQELLYLLDKHPDTARILELHGAIGRS